MALTIVLVARAGVLARCERFTVTDLGTLPELDESQSCYATAVNNRGEVAGWCGDYIDGISRRVAFYWNSVDGMISLGTGGDVYSQALGINNAGVVVGYTYEDISPWHSWRAFTYSNGRLERLEIPDASYTAAFSNNDAGVITGQLDEDVLLYDHGTLIDVGRIAPADIVGRAINNRGDVVGSGWVDGEGNQHAFLFRNGVLMDIHGLDGKSSYAQGINNLGQAVGWAETGEVSENGPIIHAVTFDDGKVNDLNPFNSDYSYATAINDHGWLLGAYRREDIGYGTFLYMNGHERDLQNLIPPDQDWYLDYANDINERGQIVGSAYGPGNRDHAVLLTPIPEPASIQLLITSFATVLVLRQRRFA